MSVNYFVAHRSELDAERSRNIAGPDECDRFGIKHSHGCINLALTDAQWLFEWATPEGGANYTLSDEENEGTWVWVHE